MSDSRRRSGRTHPIRIAVVLVLVLIAACGRTDSDTPGPAPARTPPAIVVTEERSGERIVDLTVRSTALGGTAPVRLVTPTGWDARTPGRTWPVLYLLPGGDGDHASWTADSDVEELPQLRDVLVVIPSMPMFGFYTNWHNAGREDPRQVETFHLDEVIPLLERDYGAGQRRVVAGLSQGGYGALKYTAQHPGMFRAAASYSGWLHPLRRADVVLAAARVVGADGAALWGDPLRDRAVWEANDVYHLSDKLIGVPIYLSAGTGAPGEFDLPDLPREELFPELDRLADEFPGDVVDVVEAVMDESTRAVAERLRRLGGEPITNFTAGTHNPPYWEREFHRSLPMLLDALGTTR